MNFIQKMCRYKAWANAITYEALSVVQPDEIYNQRQSCFDSIFSTLTHNYTIDDIFRSHLLGEPHNHHSKNIEQPVTLDKLQAMVSKMDAWWIDYADRLETNKQDEIVEFSFIDGSEGQMSRQEIVLHTVNHSTYHRGYIDEMLYSISVVPPTTDYPAFLKVS